MIFLLVLLVLASIFEGFMLCCMSTFLIDDFAVKFMAVLYAVCILFLIYLLLR